MRKAVCVRHVNVLTTCCVLCRAASYALQVECEGAQSSWNVDGELLRHGRVNVGIHAGLVDVFARGVELM
jgi:hypothetical protein